MIETQPDLVDELRGEQERIAEGCAEKDLDALTEQEKVAICFMAGIPMTIEPDYENRTVRIGTACKVGIAKHRGKFRVFSYRK